MAYSNSTSDRMDELRFRSQQSPRNDASLLGLVSPPRNGNRVPQPLQQDGRGGLMRRFTTDSGRVPTIASLTNQRGAQDSPEYGPSVSYCPPPQFLLSFTTPHQSSYSFPIANSLSILYNSLPLAFANLYPLQTYHKVQLVSNSSTPNLISPYNPTPIPNTTFIPSYCPSSLYSFQKTLNRFTLHIPQPWLTP